MKKGKMSIASDFPPDTIDAFIIEQINNNIESSEEMMEVRLPASQYELDLDAPSSTTTKDTATVIVIEL